MFFGIAICHRHFDVLFVVQVGYQFFTRLEISRKKLIGVFSLWLTFARFPSNTFPMSSEQISSLSKLLVQRDSRIDELLERIERLKKLLEHHMIDDTNFICHACDEQCDADANCGACASCDSGILCGDCGELVGGTWYCRDCAEDAKLTCDKCEGQESVMTNLTETEFGMLCRDCFPKNA